MLSHVNTINLILGPRSDIGIILEYNILSLRLVFLNIMDGFSFFSVLLTSRFESSFSENLEI